MIRIDSLPLTIITKLIEAEFKDRKSCEVVAINPSTEFVDDYGPNPPQLLSAIISIEDDREAFKRENGPHPWTLVWNCNDSEFESLMRDDQSKTYGVGIELGDYDTIKSDDLNVSLDFHPIHSINMRQVLPEGSDYIFHYEDGAQVRRLCDVIEQVNNYLADRKLNDSWQDALDKDIVFIDSIHVHDDGEAYVSFDRVEND